MMSATILFRAAAAIGLLAISCAESPPPPRMSSSMASKDQNAECPGGATVVGGGYEIVATARTPGKMPIVVVNRPTETGWIVQCIEPDGQPSAACKAYVLCASLH
jgi:hypothetical protein